MKKILIQLKFIFYQKYKRVLGGSDKIPGIRVTALWIQCSGSHASEWIEAHGKYSQWLVDDRTESCGQAWSSPDKWAPAFEYLPYIEGAVWEWGAERTGGVVEGEWAAFEYAL